jgi:drug/metabolite transporter (DMT)-like permease
MSGLLASFLGTVFTVLNKKYIKRASSVAISTLEMASGALLLTVFIPTLNPLLFHEKTIWFPSLDVHNLTLDRARDGPFDLIWVIILALLCTNVTFYLSMFALKHLSAFTVNLTGNMEPIYGIVFGAIFFHVRYILTYLHTCTLMSTISSDGDGLFFTLHILYTFLFIPILSQHI